MTRVVEFNNLLKQKYKTKSTFTKLSQNRTYVHSSIYPPPSIQKEGKQVGDGPTVWQFVVSSVLYLFCLISTKFHYLLRTTLTITNLDTILKVCLLILFLMSGFLYQFSSINCLPCFGSSTVIVIYAMLNNTFIHFKLLYSTFFTQFYALIFHVATGYLSLDTIYILTACFTNSSKSQRLQNKTPINLQCNYYLFHFQLHAQKGFNS